ncbi:MAG: antitoxin VapB family protein [Nanoarchaeota archaeon]
MGTKTISIMDDAYELLTSLKAPEESFTMEIRRLALNTGGIMELAGAWKDLSEEDARKMKERILERRRERQRLEELENQR